MGLQKPEFNKIKIITYAWNMIDMGICRCSICFRDFASGDRLKEYPICNHVFHIKCLRIWMSFEAKCAHCLKPFPGEKQEFLFTNLQTELNTQVA